MSDVPGRIIDRLRTNLRTAEIRLTDADLEGMVEKGFLRTVIEFEEIERRTPADALPDYVTSDDWTDTTRLEPQANVPVSSPEMEAENADPARGPEPPSITEVGRRLLNREVSPVELARTALERIEERDPELNAFQLVLAERALEAARRAEREIAAGAYRGALHGVPIAVKDLFAMRDTPTTGGSRILAGWVPDYDAACVERLKAAGAVIVGKTRLSEFAYSPGSNNAHYGPTRNPWNPAHDSGGSSSGSAVAVAAGLVYAALGSDTGGSIRIPASLCGIVGLKPTFGRISLYGAVPLAWSLDHPGPLTRTVADAHLLLQTVSGPDERDPRTRVARPPSGSNLYAGVRGLRIGVLGDDGSGRTLGIPEALEAWRAGLEALERDGAELVPVDLPRMRDLRILNSALIGLETCAYHEPWLRERLDEYGPFMRHRVLAAYAHGPRALVRAQQARAELRREVDAIWERVDLLSTPTMPYGAPPLGEPGATVFTNPFNLLGWPAITVPVGLTAQRLPLGLQLAGRPWDEATVLRAAHVVEAGGPWPGGEP